MCTPPSLTNSHSSVLFNHCVLLGLTTSVSDVLREALPVDGDVIRLPGFFVRGKDTQGAVGVDREE